MEKEGQPASFLNSIPKSCTRYFFSATAGQTYLQGRLGNVLASGGPCAQLKSRASTTKGRGKHNGQSPRYKFKH